jgi:hypothetical protein
MQYVRPRWIECPDCGRRYGVLIVKGWPDRFYEQHTAGCRYGADIGAESPQAARRQSPTRRRRPAPGERYSRPYGAAEMMKG